MKQLLRLFLFLSLPLPPAYANHNAALDPNETHLSGRMPNFGHPDLVKAPYSIVMSKQNGNWLSSTTWEGDTLPTDNSVVHIHHEVTFNAADFTVMVVAIYPGGKLQFATNQNTRLKVTHLLVHKDGVLEIGTDLQPVEADKKAEVVFRDWPMNTGGQSLSFYDPGQYGNGLVVLGTVRVHGALKTPTFVRVSQEPRRGNTSLSLEESVSGWNARDRLEIPDTRHLLMGGGEIRENYVPQWEEMNLASAGGLSLNLQNGLAFDHVGTIDGNNDGRPDFLPHVANLTRNVVFRSETPVETGKTNFCSGGDKITSPNTCVTRGHTLFTGVGDVDLRYAEFVDMGRTTENEFSSTTYDTSGNVTRVGTNQEARHALNIHYLSGPYPTVDPQYQYKLIGNVVRNSTLWPLAIRSSHYGLIKDNIVFNGKGAGVITLSGNESYNEFNHNFVFAMRGNRSPRDKDAREGALYFFYGFNHILKDNVAANGTNPVQEIVSGVGYKFFWRNDSSANTPIPSFQGADTTQAGQYRLVDMQTTPILQFSGNEAYGAMATGLTIWHLGSDGYSAKNISETVMRNSRYWHLFEEAIWGYPMQNITFDGLVIRGHPRALIDHSFGRGFTCGDYWCGNITIRNADVQGYGSGFSGSENTPGTFTIEDSYMKNYGTGVSVPTLATPGNGAYKPPRKTVVRRVKFDPWPGQSLSTVGMAFSTARGRSDYIQKDELFVYDYQKIPGDHFRVYDRAQHPLFIVPQTTYRGDDNNNDGVGDLLDSRGSPEAGLTNQQNWDKYNPNGTLKTDPNALGLAIRGSIAPCAPSDPLGTCSPALAKPGVWGFVFPTVEDTTPPSIPQNLTVTVRSESQIDLSWSPSTDVESGVAHYEVYRNGQVIIRTNATSYSDRSGLVENQTYSYQVQAVNNTGLGSGLSGAISATTPADTTPPTLINVRAQGNPKKVLITFSEPVAETGAKTIANYAIDNGITISSASLAIDLKTVTLTTSDLSEGINYTLTVNNIKDRARTPNTIAPNSQKSFTYSSTAVGNQAPSVNAGTDKTVAWPNTLALAATVSDDGQPSSSLTLLWTRESGPGAVTFNNDSIEDPVATFPSAGVYVLKLAAFDGELESSDTMTITVSDAGIGQTEIPKFKNILNPLKGELVSMSVTGEASVDIYTKSGSLVRRLKDNGSGSIDWDGRNEKGEIVSSGVYLWKIKLGNNGDKTETRKVVVLK